MITVIIPLVLSALNAAVSSADESNAGSLMEQFGKYVFTVNAYTRLDPGGARNEAKESRWRRNVGTAFPIDDQGYLVTLNCVVRDAERIQVTGGNGEKFDASLVGKNESEGISVLKVTYKGGFSFPHVRPVRRVRPGTRVLFLGIPPGGALAAVSGNVEAVRSSDGALVITVSGDPGTSGTPVFDLDGWILGLLAFHLEDDHRRGLSDNNKSYLVFPMEYATLLARSIINRFEAKSGWLGVKAAPDDLTISEVVFGSPAEKAGIRSGDRIVEFNDVLIRNPEDLLGAVESTRAGDTVRVRVIRNGKPMNFTPRLMEYPWPERK